MPQGTIEPVTFEYGCSIDTDEDFSISSEDLEFDHVMLCFVCCPLSLRFHSINICISVYILITCCQ
jgi:hypothetical protein